ncbi:LysR family transcriptional regulator substrate-binding protein [Paenibacillus rhizoplanae]
MVEEAQHALKQPGELTGTIVISADETLCTYRLPAVLQKFRQLHPGVRLIFLPLVSPSLKQSLRDGDVDVIFMLDEMKGESGFCGEKNKGGTLLPSGRSRSSAGVAPGAGYRGFPR